MKPRRILMIDNYGVDGLYSVRSIRSPEPQTHRYRRAQWGRSELLGNICPIFPIPIIPLAFNLVPLSGDLVPVASDFCPAFRPTGGTCIVLPATHLIPTATEVLPNTCGSLFLASASIGSRGLRQSFCVNPRMRNPRSGAQECAADMPDL